MYESVNQLIRGRLLPSDLSALAVELHEGNLCEVHGRFLLKCGCSTEKSLEASKLLPFNYNQLSFAQAMELRDKEYGWHLISWGGLGDELVRNGCGKSWLRYPGLGILATGNPVYHGLSTLA